MKVKRGRNPYGMRIIEVTEINSEDPEEWKKVVDEIKKWMRSPR